MKVLRIETHAHGVGPYQLDLGGSVARGQPHKPSPGEDIPEWYDQVGRGSNDYLFGFLDLEQLFAWWDVSELAGMLQGSMLQISLYEVEDHKVLVGTCQIAFDFRCATYVRKLTI